MGTKIKGQYMNRSTFWMIKYMNGSVFSKARYMNGVGFEILARTPVLKLPLSYPPPPPAPPPPPHTHTHTPPSPSLGNLEPDRFRGRYPTMPESEISVKGVAKLLSILNQNQNFTGDTSNDTHSSGPVIWEVSL